MSIRSIAIVLVVAGAVPGASAQVITTPGITARLDLTWQEDPTFPHNDNGFLEPGEHALMLMSLSFTGQFTQVTFVPAVNGFSAGTILGLGSAFLDIRSDSQDPTGIFNGGITVPPSSSIGPDADADGASGYGIRGGWRIGGDVANGSPATNGFLNLGPGQYPPAPSAANTTAPLSNLERLEWQPNSYSDRVVRFSVRSAEGGVNLMGLYLDYDHQSGGFAYVPFNQITLGAVNIPVRSVPAPAGFAVLIGALAMRRRRSIHALRESPLDSAGEAATPLNPDPV